MWKLLNKSTFWRPYFTQRGKNSNSRCKLLLHYSLVFPHCINKEFPNPSFSLSKKLQMQPKKAQPPLPQKCATQFRLRRASRLINCRHRGRRRRPPVYLGAQWGPEKKKIASTRVVTRRSILIFIREKTAWPLSVLLSVTVCLLCLCFIFEFLFSKKLV